MPKEQQLEYPVRHRRTQIQVMCRSIYAVQAAQYTKIRPGAGRSVQTGQRCADFCPCLCWQFRFFRQQLVIIGPVVEMNTQLIFTKNQSIFIMFW
jgi:hypothetical protein